MKGVVTETDSVNTVGEGVGRSLEDDVTWEEGSCTLERRVGVAESSGAWVVVGGVDPEVAHGMGD